MAIDFTGTAPITGGGQVFVRNSNGEWEKANVTAPGVVQTVITATGSGTHTWSPGAIAAKVTLTGGGGGGGYANTAAAGDAAAGAGGEAGATVIKFYTSAEMGADAAYTVGAGGTGGVGSTLTASTDGSNSSFNPAGSGATITADGGDRGSDGNSTVADNCIDGGVGEGIAASGDLNIQAGDGQSGWSLESNTGNLIAIAGNGGGSYWGSGARGGNVSPGTSSASAAGEDADAFGAGGGGAGAIAGGNNAGGAGGDGVLIIEEYIRQSVLSPVVYDSSGDPLLDLSDRNNPTFDFRTVPADTYPTLIILTTTANGYDQANLLFKNENSSPADGDYVGQIQFNSQNSAAEDIEFVAINAHQGDVTDATEDGYLTFRGATNGTIADVWARIDGDGLKFNGDTAAANALDDYEEGSFTPVITQGWTSVTYSNQVGGYTKIGDQVFFDMRVVFSGTSAANQVQVGGLPFTVGGGSVEYSPTVGYVDAPVNQTDVYAYTYAAITYVVLYGAGGVACNSNGNATDKYIYISGSYKV